jgi:GT2 family glycosyltransferase
MIEKIGIGILTCNRPTLLKKLVDSIRDRDDCELIIINDGDPFLMEGYNYYVQRNEKNLGVAKSKNKALRHLLDKGCDHIFLIEDDIYIKDPSVFEKYIETSKITGIQHFNFSQHGMMNKSWPDAKIPNPRVCVEYKELELPLYPHCVGAFSYYSRKCLEKVGLMDERYFNACEHVDHTLDIIKAGMHPPFWYFADIEKSWEYLGDEEWSREKSTISSHPNHNQMMKDADVIFREKHGCVPVDIKLLDRQKVGIALREIQQKYGFNDTHL